MEPTQPAASKNFYIVFTVGIPGLGKSYAISHFVAHCEKYPNHSLRICVSDDIRSKTLAKHYADNNIELEKLSQKEIYDIEVQVQSITRDALYRRIREEFQEMFDAHTTQNFFILDKNHCNKQLIAYVNELAEEFFKGFNIHRGIFVPEIFAQGDDQSLYPFKFDTLLIGLCRSLHRKQHLTMKFGATHSLLSFITCLKSQLRDHFDEKFPPELYIRLPIQYYGKQPVEDVKAKEDLKAHYTTLRALIDDMIAGKKSIEESVQGVVDAVELLIAANTFEKFGVPEIEKLYQSIVKLT
jgi:hypothetical protein